MSPILQTGGRGLGRPGAFLRGPQSPKCSLLGFEPRPGCVRGPCPLVPYCHCFSGLQSGQKPVPSFGHNDCRVPVSTSSDGPALRAPELSQAIDACFLEQRLPVLGVERKIGLSGIACPPRPHLLLPANALLCRRLQAPCRPTREPPPLGRLQPVPLPVL